MNWLTFAFRFPEIHQKRTGVSVSVFLAERPYASRESPGVQQAKAYGIVHTRDCSELAEAIRSRSCKPGSEEVLRAAAAYVCRPYRLTGSFFP